MKQPRQYSADKIRRIEILQKECAEHIIVAALVIQYESVIATVSIKSKVFKIQCESAQMVKEYQIRGSNESIYFGQVNLDRSSIMKLEFHAKSTQKIIKTEIFSLNRQIAAMEINNDPS